MNKFAQLKRIKTLNLFILALDLLFVIVYTVLFGFLFSVIKSPASNLSFENPAELMEVSYKVLGRTFSSVQVNLTLSVLVIFMVIGYAMLVVNFKHNAKLEVYDYHRWEAGNIAIKGLSSVLTLNFVGLILRILSANLTLQYAEDENVISIFKKIKAERQEKKAREAQFEKKDLTAEEFEIKKKVRRQTTLKVVRYLVIYLALLFFALFVLIPFYWMILTALKTYEESKSLNPSFWVSFKDLQWVNIKFVIKELNFGVYIKNTIIVAILSTIGTIITTILAAFAFARIDFKGREALFSLLLMTMMIPGEIYMITNFLTVSNSKNGFAWIGAGDNTIGYFATLILPNMISVFYIFFLRQAFKQVPDSLYKAAKIDGCSDFKYLRRVMIPIAGPTIFTITILNILGAWSAFMWPRLITSVEPNIGKKYWLISVALREESFVLESGGSTALPMFNLQIAASAIVTVPLIVVFLLLRKYIMSGVGRSGTKG